MHTCCLPYLKLLAMVREAPRKLLNICPLELEAFTSTYSEILEPGLSKTVTLAILSLLAEAACYTSGPHTGKQIWIYHLIVVSVGARRWSEVTRTR